MNYSFMSAVSYKQTFAAQRQPLGCAVYGQMRGTLCVPVTFAMGKIACPTNEEQ